MHKINLFVTEANDNLSACGEIINRAVNTAKEYAFSKLNITWDIDLIVTNRVREFIIPEDGVGGRTHSSDLIFVSIDEDKITEDILSEALVHELCHAARWGKNNERMNTMFDGIINEGIATFLESEFVKDNVKKQFFLSTVTSRSEDENIKIFNYLQNNLRDECYNYQTIFFEGNEKLPRWSGYSLGYFIFKKYLEQTGKNIEDAFADRYAQIESVLL